MDELLKALAEAIRQGTTFAMPALVGYYVVRTIEALMFPVTMISVVFIAGRTVRAGMNIYHEKNAALWETRRQAHDAKRALYTTKRTTEAT